MTQTVLMEDEDAHAGDMRQIIGELRSIQADLLADKTVWARAKLERLLQRIDRESNTGTEER